MITTSSPKLTVVVIAGSAGDEDEVEMGGGIANTVFGVTAYY